MSDGRQGQIFEKPPRTPKNTKANSPNFELASACSQALFTPHCTEDQEVIF